MLRKDDVTLRQTKQIKIKNDWRIDGLEEGGDGRKGLESRVKGSKEWKKKVGRDERKRLRGWNDKVGGVEWLEGEGLRRWNEMDGEDVRIRIKEWKISFEKMEGEGWKR